MDLRIQDLFGPSMTSEPVIHLLVHLLDRLLRFVEAGDSVGLLDTIQVRQELACSV